MARKAGLVWAALAVAGLVGAATFTATSPSAVWAQQVAGPLASVKVGVRRITETQYRHAIADVFGPDIKISTRFEPEKREEGLLAIGSTHLSLTPSGFELYFALATSISDQALSDARRGDVVGCRPKDPRKADEVCARQFVEKYGKQLFRRPLAEAQTTARVKTASLGAQQAGDFYAGLKLALSSLLMDPDFIFRIHR